MWFSIRLLSFNGKLGRKTLVKAEAEVIINTKLKPIKVHAYLNPYYIREYVCVFAESREKHS